MNEACQRAAASLSTEKLQRLFDDDDKLRQFAKEIPEIRDIQRRHKALRDDIRCLAQANLAQAPVLEEKKTNYIDSLEVARGVKEVYDTDKAQLELYSQSVTPANCLQMLQEKATKSEEETDRLSEKFLDGKLDVNDFVAQFELKRKACHQLRIKAEKMSSLLLNDGTSPGWKPSSLSSTE
ncbi:vacuolar protein sorting-associated protein 37B-like [Oscarella lobularis]|uniref:vacuolar protein sorting-associated protein 37B-like n=1 Tax=Oscarella lobularis TaxID=121494 RepID=UPI003313CD71